MSHICQLAFAGIQRIQIPQGKGGTHNTAAALAVAIEGQVNFGDLLGCAESLVSKEYVLMEFSNFKARPIEYVPAVQFVPDGVMKAAF